MSYRLTLDWLTFVVSHQHLAFFTQRALLVLHCPKQLLARCQRRLTVVKLGGQGVALVLYLNINNIGKKRESWSYSSLYSHIKYTEQNTCSYNFNSPSYTGMYFHNVVGTGRYTTSTTNVYKKDFTYRAQCLGEVWVNPWLYPLKLLGQLGQCVVVPRCFGECLVLKIDLKK